MPLERTSLVVLLVSLGDDRVTDGEKGEELVDRRGAGVGFEVLSETLEVVDANLFPVCAYPEIR